MRRNRITRDRLEIQAITLHEFGANVHEFITPETRLGCPDGLCYLKLFKMGAREDVKDLLGHFPSILMIASIPVAKRKQTAQGTIEFVTQNIAHYEHTVPGDNVWKKIDKIIADSAMMTRLSNRTYTQFLSSPPTGYKYAIMFKVKYRSRVMEILGAGPMLQELYSYNRTMRHQERGRLLQTVDGSLKICDIRHYNPHLWQQVDRLAPHHPNVRVIS